ncbi:SnoaL-like domain-containing protein [Ilyonectria destructans]|nr:SnoaL-like domain-containing protein [Ilyonectria destructans]
MPSADSLQSLLVRIQRIEDINEIHNIMGRRAYYHSAGRHDLEVDELWSSQDDVVFEAEDVGAWTSLKTIKESYVEKNPFPAGTKGLLVEHTITTPVVEIAGDGQTAKGIWISPGHETFPLEGCDVPKAHWSWGRYAVDFRKEDGKWKIWHLHVLTTFRTPFDDDWAKTAFKKPEWLPKDGEGVSAADRGVSFNEPYHPSRAPKLQPVPPEAYTSWKDTWSATDLHEFTR